MRVMYGLAVIAASLSAQPALAADGAALWGKAPLRMATGDTAPLAGDLHANLQSAGLVSTSSADATFRKRLVGTGVEYFPVSGSGFHLAASTRLFARAGLAADTEQARLLAGPRTTYGTPGRMGYRRMTPAMTVGYTRAVGGGDSLGIEAGAMMGRAFNGMPTLSRTGSLAFDRQTGGANPVVNLVFGHKF